MTATAVPDLAWPSQDSLLLAIRGQHIGRHPITRWAYQLGVVHTLLLDQPATVGIGCRRDRLVTAIDRWLRERAPAPHPNARPCPESVGALVDRIAAMQVRAFRLLMTRAADDPEVHDSWTSLAVLVEAYNDLVTGIDHRIYHLHTPQP